MFDSERPDFTLYDLFVPLTVKKSLIIIIAAGFIVFFNALFNQFVWDDLTYIVFNPDIHSLYFLALIKENSFNSIGQYRAVTAIYFALVYMFFHTTPFYYHSFQVCMHILNACLLFLLFKKFFSTPLSLFLSIVFLVHPIQTESVSFIGSTDNVLFFLFGISALLICISKKLNMRMLSVIFLFLLLSLLAKETGIGFLCLVLLAGIFYRRKKAVSLFILGLFVCVLYSLLRFGVAGVYFDSSSLKNIIPIDGLRLPGRLGNIPEILFFYIQTFLFPQKLAIDQLWIIPRINAAYFYIPLFLDGVFFLVIVIFLIYCYRARNKLAKTCLFFSLWFIGGLLMHAQIVPLDGTVADRWFYFPIAGLLGIAGCIISLSGAIVKNRRYLYVASVLILILLSVRTIVRNADWTDNMTLYSHDATVSDNYDIESNLGSFYAQVGNYPQARKHEGASVAMFPYDINLSNLAYIDEETGDYPQAEKYYQQSINTVNTSPSHREIAAHSYLHWGGLYLFHGNPARACRIFLAGLHVFPRYGPLWAFLAIGEYNLHQNRVALEAAGKAVTYFPGESSVKLYSLILHNKPVVFQNL